MMINEGTGNVITTLKIKVDSVPIVTLAQLLNTYSGHHVKNLSTDFNQNLPMKIEDITLNLFSCIK